MLYEGDSVEEYLKRGYLMEDYRLFHLCTTQDEPVELHYHEFCKILFLFSGSGSYLVDGQRYLLQPGDVVLVGSRCVHRPEMDEGIPYERGILYISPEFLRMQSTADCDLLGCFTKTQGHVLRLNEAGRRQLFSMTMELERVLSGEAYGKEILGRTALLQLMVEIGRNRERMLPDPVGVMEPDSQRVKDVMKYLDANFVEDVSIERLADAFYVSKYHLMRQFRQETGVTIHTYLIQRRLMCARELIARGVRSTEACYRAGFQSYSSFTRAYGKYYGMTPTGRLDAAGERKESYE